MSAGTSTSQNRITRIVAASALLVGLFVASAAAQTGQVMPSPKFTAYDANGDPCNGCKLFAYVAGTTTKQDTYTSSTLGTPNANPVVLDSAGRATVFLDPTDSYKFVLAPADDTDPPAAAHWTVDNVVGPFSGVVSITAASTRGLQISRSAAEAGLSIASSGGSGKTYGIVSNTSGAFIIRDDADGTPNLTISGNDITATQTGTFSIPSGLFSVGGFGTHAASAGGTGGNIWSVRNTTAGTGNYGQIQIGNDGAADAFVLRTTASSFTTAAPYTQDAAHLIGTRAGGLRLAATNAAGDVVIATGGASPTNRVTVDEAGLTTITNLQPTITKSGTAQPGFLAYNTAADSVATGATVDFDAEVYDTTNNFASDQFTAPQTGIYEFCTGVTYSDNAASQFTVSINPTGALYQVYHALAETAGGGGGCIHLPLTTGDGVVVIVNTTDAAATIEAVSGSYRQTWFSGRLVP